jgi:predicted RNase H-like HicB family nuclease
MNHRAGASGTSLHADVHRERDGSLWAHVSELPGCFASGDDLDQLVPALAEAIARRLNERRRPAIVNLQLRSR